MKKLLNTLLLSTALVCCSNSYSLDANGHYNILYDTINGDGLNSFLFDESKCQVATNCGTVDSNNDKYQLGQLYYKDGKIWKELIDDEERPYFDLSTVVTEDVKDNGCDQIIKNYIINGGWNLIIKLHNSKIYTLDNDDLTLYGGNTNLIIPNGITLTKTDGYNILFKSGCNNTVLILGKMSPYDDSNYKSIVDFGQYDAQNNVKIDDTSGLNIPQSAIMMQNSKIIIGPGAIFGKGANYGCCSVGSNTCETKFILYPGSKIEQSADPQHNIGISQLGHLYLNRFLSDPNKNCSNNINSEVDEKMHVIYPTVCKDYDYKLQNDDSGNTITEYFPNLKFCGVLENDNGPVKMEDVNYSFEYVKSPLDFNFDKRRQKLMLGFNPKNEFAEYDSKCWIECGLNFGKYSLNYYNTPGSKGSYINVDDMYKFFFDVHRETIPIPNPDSTKVQETANLKRQLIIYTDKIYPGLVGNRDIQVMNDEDKDVISGSSGTDLKSLYCAAVKSLTNITNFTTSEALPSLEKTDTISLYGDNSEYTGTIDIPEGVNNIYLDKNSLVNIKQNDNSKLSGITFHLLGNNRLDFTQYGTGLNMNLDNTKSNGTLEIVNSGSTRTVIEFGGNWSNYEGKVTIPTDISEVDIKYSDPLFKIKHKDNDDLSGLTYVLYDNLKVDLKNIQNSTFEMNLQGNEKTITLIDTSKPTSINKVTFSGNNTKYKDSGGAENSGIVVLTSNITEVEFTKPESFVNLQAFNTTKTLLKNNILSSETSEIKVSPDNYNASNITYATDEKREVVASIENYNKPWIVWDTSTLNDCFSDGQKYDPSGSASNKGLLNNFPIDILSGVIKAKLLGNDDIVTYSSGSPDTMSFFGKNMMYKGTMTIPVSVKNLWFNDNSLIAIKQKNNDTLSNITFHLLGNNRLDLAKYSTDLYVNLDNTKSNGTLEIIDSGNTGDKKTEIGFGGNWSNYEGKVTIPSTIKTIYTTSSSDPLFKIKHKDNDDLSGLTYVLNDNLKVDLKNIQNSTFEMNLQSDGKTITLTDSSKPTSINKVTFSGNNTKYKDGDGNNNAGIVKLTSNITEVEFTKPESFVNLQAFNTTKTLLKNNILSSETSEIKVSPDSYTGNITYNNTDDRDEIQNIGKYNIPGVVWDTNTLENCFKDGDKILTKFPINIINADLKGNKNIKIQTSDNIVALLGNNNLYTGTITIPEHITDVYLKNNSKPKNIVHTGDSKLQKLHFHYEGQKLEKTDNNFCVPFNTLEKAIHNKAPEHKVPHKFEVDNKSFEIHGKFNTDEFNNNEEFNSEPLFDRPDMNEREYNHNNNFDHFNKDKEKFDKYEEMHRKYLENDINTQDTPEVSDDNKHHNKHFSKEKDRINGREEAHKKYLEQE